MTVLSHPSHSFPFPQGKSWNITIKQAIITSKAFLIHKSLSLSHSVSRTLHKDLQSSVFMNLVFMVSDLIGI